MGLSHKYGCWLGFGGEGSNSASISYSLSHWKSSTFGSPHSALEVGSVVGA